jgi:dTDP-4-amino-4,6-dideoxygalactose transaminase
LSGHRGDPRGTCYSAPSTSLTSGDHSQFAIGFDRRDLPRLHELWDEIILSERWSEGEMTERFEDAWGSLHGLGSVATGGWTGAALAAFDFAGVRGEKVLCPSNTFMATPLSIIRSGGEPVFVDCNREDLCMSFDDFRRKAERHRPRAAVLVHIGGHIAFEVEQIAEYCHQDDFDRRGRHARLD